MDNNNLISNNVFRKKKKPLYIFLPEEVDKALRKFIALKHQRVEKGLISYEVEQAIQNHISIYNTEQHDTQKDASEKQKFEVSQLMDQVNRYFIESKMYDEAPINVPERHIDLGIIHLRGVSDSRTIKKWRNLLVDYDHIRQIGKKQYQILRRKDYQFD